MKLYKFRSLANFERLLDIVLHERLYCAPFEALNDPLEGLFITVSHFSPVMLQSTGTVRRTLDIASSLNEHEKCRMICSLSASFKDIRLWTHYADGHKGVAIEIDFSGHEADAMPITYRNQIQQYSNTVLGWPFPDEVLLQKTEHWRYENEVRILQSDSFYSIAGRITSIYLGERLSSNHKDLLNKSLPTGIPMIETEVNKITLEVEPKRTFHRNPAKAS